MSRAKQIEEMSVLIYTGRCLQKSYVEIAECLYNEGYRKQSEPISCGHEKGGEWISVEDRLPEEGKQVLVITPRGLVTVCRYEWRSDKHLGVMLRFHRCDNLKAVRTQYWMPLPEAPKGGAE